MTNRAIRVNATRLPYGALDNQKKLLLGSGMAQFHQAV